MGDENNVTVNDIVAEETNIVETEDERDSGGSFKQAAGIAAITTVMIGAGYGLYRLGKVVVGKAKDAYEHHQAEKYIDSFDDEEEIEETVKDDHKKK